MILPLLACLTLVGASSAPLALSSLPFGNETLPQCAVYNDSNRTITLTAVELNSYTFQNLSNALLDDSLVFTGSTIGYGDEIMSFEDSTHTVDDCYVFYSDVNSIQFDGYGYGDTNNKFIYKVNDVVTPFETEVLWSIASEFTYSTLKTAIQADIEANQSGMSGIEVVNEIVDILAGGLTSLGSSLGGAIATFAQSLAFQDGELSVYFVLIVVFAGVSLAIGLTTLLFNWLTNLGR